MPQQPEKPRSETLNPADLAQLQRLRYEARIAQLEADKADLNARNAILGVYLRTGLNEADRVDLNNGSIQRVPSGAKELSAVEEGSDDRQG